MTEGEPTEEKTEFEWENQRQDLGGGERRELWLDEARNRTNDRDTKKQDEDRWSRQNQWGAAMLETNGEKVEKCRGAEKWKTAGGRERERECVCVC